MRTFAFADLSKLLNDSDDYKLTHVHLSSLYTVLIVEYPKADLTVYTGYFVEGSMINANRYVDIFSPSCESHYLEASPQALYKVLSYKFNEDDETIHLQIKGIDDVECALIVPL